MGPVEERIMRLLEPTVSAMGYELLGIEYLGQGKHSRLRLFIDSPDGIGLADCEKVSRQVSGILDVEDPVKGHYSLEVSSPGLDRPLFRTAHYAAHIGEQVKLRLRQAIGGRRNFKGRIDAVEGESIYIVTEDGEQVTLVCDEVEKANLVPQFDETTN
jgi:ribosome maturation factor RimP